MSEIYYTENMRLGCWTGKQFPPFLTEELTENFEKIDEAYKASESAFQQVYDTIDEVNSRVSLITATATAWARGITARLDAIGKVDDEQNIRISENENQIQANRIEIDSLDDRLTTAEDDILNLTPPHLESIETRLGIAEGNIALNAETLAGFSKRLSDDEENIKMHAYRLSNLERNLGSDGNRLKVLDQLNDKVNDQAVEISNVKRNLGVMESSITGIDKEVKALQENEVTQNETLVTLSGSVTNLLERMDKTEQTIMDIISRLPPVTAKAPT